MGKRWYAAHIIMLVQFKDLVQDTFPLWENIVLIEAESSEEADDKARRLGKDAEGDSAGTFCWDDRPATWVFAGIRKLIECQDSEIAPRDGVEISYSQLVVQDKASVNKLVQGVPVTVLYEE